MKRIFNLILLLCMVSMVGWTQEPIVMLDKTYGTTAPEISRMVRVTPDGGYLIAGDAEINGNHDFYLIKTDSEGNVIWENNYGFQELDRIQWAMDNGFQILYDGTGNISGYIMVGTTTSYTGHGEGGLDVMLVKTDPNGNELWKKTFGGEFDDYGRIVRQTSDGGFIITGVTFSFGVLANDVYLIKTDGDGNMLWQATYNLNVWEDGNDVVEVPGGYLVTGTGGFLFKVDYNGDPDPNYGNTPAQTGYGTIHRQVDKYTQIIPGEAFSIQPISNGFMVCGTTGGDSFLAQLDNNCNILPGWPKVIPGPGANNAYVVKPVSGPGQPGYMVAGETNGMGAGNWDFWLFRTDLDGNVLWQKTYGGPGNEWCTSMQSTADGGFALTGVNTSFGAGGLDMWLLKIKEIINPAIITGRLFVDNNNSCNYDELDPDIPMLHQSVTLYPGPFIATTGKGGNYEFKVEPGTYSIVSNSAKLEPNACTTDDTIHVSIGSGEVIGGQDFAMQTLGQSDCEATVHIVSGPFEEADCEEEFTLSSPCPTFEHEYHIILCNTGDLNINLQHSSIDVTLPQDFTYVSGSIESSCDSHNNSPFDPPNTSTPGHLTWDGSNMGGVIHPTECCTLSFKVMVGMNAQPPFTVSAIFNADCVGSGNNTSAPSTSFSENDACACDPNDMQVWPRGCGPDGNIAFGEKLTYRIRFENVGTGNAHNIFLRDTLDEDLDPATLRVLTSSHAVTGVQMEPGNILVINFDGIELPPAGKGEVFFIIDHDTGLAEGTQITNRAGIYFDFNPPVITNTTTTTLRAIPSPNATFTFSKYCSTPNTTFDFNYTGGTFDGASFYWDFSANGDPSSFTAENPTGIGFTGVSTQEVELTVTRYGCVATESVEVGVMDTTPPDAVCQAVSVVLDANGEESISPEQADGGSSDNCGISNLTLSQSEFNCNHLGNNTVTFTATDFDGNTATCQASVLVDEYLSINSIIVSHESCSGYGDGSIVINASMTCTSPQIFYSINGGNSFNLTGEFVNISPGTYQILVQSGAYSESGIVSVNPGPSPTTWYKDVDGDGYTDGITQVTCSQPEGFVAIALSGDCNDNDSTVNPGAVEACNGFDDNCDGNIPANELDNDADGYRLCDGDCNDSNPAINPGAAEICNGIDDNCNGQIDEGNPPANQVYVGNLAFTTQSAINNFSQCYYKLQGNLTIQGTSISSLANLSNLQEVTGSVSVQITSLPNLTGLDALTTIGGSLTIKLNNYGSKLSSLYGLNALSTIGQNLLIFYNFSLSDCCSIDDLLSNTGVGGTISVHHNAVGCQSVSDINSSCGGGNIIMPTTGNGIGSSEVLRPKLAVYPNPASGIVTVKIDKKVPGEKWLILMDNLGRVVMNTELEENTFDFQFNVKEYSLPNGIYNLSLVSDDGIISEKLIIQ